MGLRGGALASSVNDTGSVIPSTTGPAKGKLVLVWPGGLP